MQVTEDFTLIAAKRLGVLCVYGGAPYGPQCTALRNGVDVVVGTPGRTKDLIEKQVLRLAETLEFFVLDEADEMLSMGFQDELDFIFSEIVKTKSLKEKRRQLLLFSATVPPWVRQTAKKFAQKEDEVLEIDLVGHEDRSKKTTQASTDVKHVCVPAHWQQIHETVNDVRHAYGTGGKCILFCETKLECNECVASKTIRADRRALHGDVPQKEREKTIAAFKNGEFSLLVATDVAARGLDMVVDLVIMNKPPATRTGRVDVETYVHRSGRTGRAGRKGVCVTLYSPKTRHHLVEIERTTNNTFTWAGAPRPTDIMKARATTAADAVEKVNNSAIEHFLEAANTLAETMGGDRDRALAAALAKIAGYEDGPPPARSLLSNSVGYTTCYFEANQQINSQSYVWTALRRSIDPSVCDQIRGLTLTLDKCGAVFDVPVGQLDALKSHEQVTVDLDDLPKLQEKESFGGRGGGRAGGRGGRGGGRGRGGSSYGGGAGRGRSSSFGRGQRRSF